MPTSKIVIKINDEFFLQEETLNNNPGKIIIDSKFPLKNTANLVELCKIYPILLNPANITDSVKVFQKIIDAIIRYANNGKIESLFSVISNGEVVNLMRMAQDRSAFIGENLLNYYFIEVNADEVEHILNDINEFKISNPFLGIDYAYIRGELVDIGQENSVNWADVGSSPAPNVLNNLDGFLIDEKNNTNKLIDASIKIATKNIIEFKQTEPTVQNLNKASNIGSAQKALKPDTTINTKITSLFNYCGLKSGSEIKNLPLIKVVDMEQGWRFNSTTSYLRLDSANKPILGGGINNTNLPPLSPTSHEVHGEKTINTLFGITSNPNRINGLCKGADAQIASTWFNSSTSGERREAALTSTLNNINIRDIVLLELQISRKGYDKLPVEIESAMFNVILAGVNAWFIIIEAAGNGGHNLNNPHLYPALVNTINPSKNPPIDLRTNSSGAIMVGGTNPPNRVNIGNRVTCNCFAQLCTTSSGATFDSTSLASAILTGLVAHFQNMAIDSSQGIGRRLSITEIRQLLKSLPYPIPNVSPYANFRAFLNNSNINSTSSISLP
jgi:hypothetical protein